MNEADQLIAGALRDIAAEAGLPGPVAGAAWRAGRRRRLAGLAASAVSVSGAIALALTLVLPLIAANSPATPLGSPGEVVTLTLSPASSARPASAGALAAAAQLIRQRAALLHLPDTRARVLGRNVVVTGPAADLTQLRALTMAGVLEFRQVLLYRPYGAHSTTYGHASLVNRSTLTLFGKLTCRSAVDNDNQDAQIVSCDSSGNKYLLDVAKVTGAQVRSAVAGQSTTSSQWDVTVAFNSAGASAFGKLTSQLVTRYAAGAAAGNQDDQWLDTIAVVLDGKVVTAPQTQGPITAGVAMIAGIFTRAQAQVLAAQLQSGPLPVVFRISDIRT